MAKLRLKELRKLPNLQLVREVTRALTPAREPVERGFEVLNLQNSQGIHYLEQTMCFAPMFDSLTRPRMPFTMQSLSRV